jgi:concanavalin A-like lectin/glucanase superfamily protein
MRAVLLSLMIALFSVLLAAHESSASAFVSGAYYRLGDDDPGAAAGSIGSDPTLDSFSNKLNLARSGSPIYSSDVPAQGPFGDKLSMAFANEGLGGPASPGLYSRATSLPMIDQGYALETWVKAGPTNLASIRNDLLAYNGDPASNGFGFFLHDENYVARIGTFERVLGPATVGAWHHLAYVKTFNTVDYYYDGKLVDETTGDPLAAAASGGFWLGGMGNVSSGSGSFLFNGWIDEVRYQTFNPLAAGAFNPTDFLIRPVPELSSVYLAASGVFFLLASRRRHRLLQFKNGHR